MANTQAIKRRMKSVKNTKQITKAMELVAASKMRKAQEATLRSRAYRNTAREILTRISELTNVSTHPYYSVRPVKTRLYIVITSDRGLAGAYNANMLKLFTKKLTKDAEASVKSQAIIIGKQGANFASKLEGLETVGVYENFAENPTATDLRPILDSALSMFAPAGVSAAKMNDAIRDAIADGGDRSEMTTTASGAVDEVVVLYTDFVSSIVQEAKSQVLFPAAFEPAESPSDLGDIPFEPSPEKVLETITPRLVEVQLFQAVLESQASEHVSRMMAMKSASDNASDLIDDLTLAYNSARQAGITQELAEISGGAAAVS